MRLLSPALCLTGVVATVASSVATPPPQRHFRSGIDAVLVSTVVTSGRRPVTGLRAEDFELLDNGVPQTIELVERDEVRLDVFLVLDASSSVWDGVGPNATLKTAARAAFGQLRPGDRAALLHFTHHVSVASPLTSDLAGLEASLYDIRGEGATSLLDAIATAVMIPEPSASRRTLVVVCSDGIDTASWQSADQVMDLARRSEAVVHMVVPERNRALRAPIGMEGSPSTWRVLTDIASSTGGALIEAHRTNLARAFRDIVQEFAQGYQLMFYPKGAEARGWHRLELKLRRRSGQVKARHGYYRD